MASRLNEQFTSIVRRASQHARAHLCDGDSTSAVVWDPESEREFDGDSIATVITRILARDVVEYFGVAEQHDGDTFATGYRVREEGFSGGLAPDETRFHARLAGPLAVAALDLPE